MLATLTGHPPADYPRTVENCTTLPTLDAPLPVGDGAALIRRRPDIRQAERSIAGDTARLGVAMADLYPQVSIGGSIGLSGPLKDFGSGSAFGFSLGPLLSWSFPTRPVVTARIDQADAQVRADLASLGQCAESGPTASSTTLTRTMSRITSASISRTPSSLLKLKTPCASCSIRLNRADWSDGSTTSFRNAPFRLFKAPRRAGPSILADFASNTMSETFRNTHSMMMAASPVAAWSAPPSPGCSLMCGKAVSMSWSCIRSTG
jgi:hypothetical protein